MGQKWLRNTILMLSLAFFDLIPSLSHYGASHLIPLQSPPLCVSVFLLISWKLSLYFSPRLHPQHLYLVPPPHHHHLITACSFSILHKPFPFLTMFVCHSSSQNVNLAINSTMHVLFYHTSHNFSYILISHHIHFPFIKIFQISKHVSKLFIFLFFVVQTATLLWLFWRWNYFQLINSI